MKKDVNATANALAIVGGGAYTICFIWVWVSPASFMGLMRYWFHGINIAELPLSNVDFVNGLIGLATFVIASWLFGYFFAIFYNKFAK